MIVPSHFISMKSTHYNIVATTLVMLVVWHARGQCTFTGLNSNYCKNSPASQLVPQTPGGIFSGPGITGSTFNPNTAGAGTHTITYVTCAGSYSVTQGTYSPIPFSGTSGGSGGGSGGGGGGEGGGGGSIPLLDDQIASTLTPIGFNFQFFCNTYTGFYLSANGFITFSSGQGSGCCAGGVLPSAALPLNMVTLTWADWNPAAGGSVTYTTVGVAPNRRTVISFANVPHFAAVNGGSLTAQLHLCETSNIIEIHTTLMTPYNLQAHTMGLQNANGTVAYTIPGRNGVPSWSATTEMYRFTPTFSSCVSSQTTYVSPSTVPVTGNTDICTGGTASLTASGNNTYTWSTSSNAPSITVNPSSNTTYTVSALNSFGCLASSTVGVVVSAGPPTLAISTSTNQLCYGKTATITASGATSYTWTGGITNGVGFVPSSSNTYSVTGENGCGSATAVTSISVTALPLSLSVNPGIICDGQSAVIHAVSPAISYSWLPLSTSGASSFITVFPNQSTVYTVTSFDGNCKGISTISLTVYPSPTVNLAASSTVICQGASVTLTATGNTSYTWSTNSNANSIQVNPTTNTGYTVSGANSYGCVSSSAIMVVVSSGQPLIAASSSTNEVCYGRTAFVNATGAVTYTWTNGITNGVPFTPSVTNTYIVVGQNGCGTSTAAVTISVNPIALSLVANPPVICAGQPAQLQAISPATSYSWQPSGGNGPSNTILVLPQQNTVYTVTASDGTCSGVSTVSLGVNPIPTITAIASASQVCGGDPVVLSAGGGVSYTWTPGALTGASITVNTFSSTSYYVSGSDAAGCTSGAAAVVLVTPAPSIILSASSSQLCAGNSATLQASGATSYSWNNGGASAVIIVSPGVTTYYSVTGTNNGCSASQTIGINVFTPSVSISGSTMVCEGYGASLVGSGASSYIWSTGYTFANLVVTPFTTTVYTLSTITTTGGINCAATNTVQVVVAPNPTITATSTNSSICKGASTTLTASGAATYTWNNGTVTTPTIVATSSVSAFLTYSVAGTSTAGCVGNTIYNVRVSACTGLDEYGANSVQVSVYPNPNSGDFTVNSEIPLTIRIVNQLGQIVYTTEIKEETGTVQIQNLAYGVYFVLAEKEGLHFSKRIVVSP